MFRRLFSSVDSAPSSSASRQSTASPTPAPAPKRQKRAAAPYPLPDAPNTPPFCPRHDFYPPCNAHVAKYGLPPCSEGCAAADDSDDEAEQRADITPPAQPAVDKGKGRAVKKEEDDEVLFKPVAPRREAAPTPAPAPEPARSPTPADHAAEPITPVTPAWIDGDHTLFVPNQRFVRKQFGGYSFRNTGSTRLAGTGHRRQTFTCSGHLACTGCGNTTRPNSSLHQIRKQLAKSCSFCEDEVGTLYRVDCFVRAKKEMTDRPGIVRIELEGTDVCSHQWGGGRLVKRDIADKDKRRVNVGALAARKAGPVDIKWKGGGAECMFKQK